MPQWRVLFPWGSATMSNLPPELVPAQRITEARSAALEEAARVADAAAAKLELAHRQGYAWSGSSVSAARQIAAAIRALKATHGTD